MPGTQLFGVSSRKQEKTCYDEFAFKVGWSHSLTAALCRSAHFGLSALGHFLDRAGEGEKVMNYKRALMAAAGSLALLVAACETTQTTAAADTSVSAAEAARIAELERQLNSARSQNNSLSSRVSSLQSEVSSARAAASSSSSSSYDSVASSAGYPPDARAGQCFSRVLIPEITSTSSEEVIDQPEATEIRVIQATYDFADEQILVKEESVRYSVIPATYTTVTEQVLVQPELREVKVIPAVYEDVSEEILVRPAYTTWKPGAGLIGGGAGSGYRTGPDGRIYGPDGRVLTSVVQPTGEILCKVEVPPKYKTVTRKRLVRAETTDVAVIPARYDTITKQVVAEPPRVDEVIIPAEYRTIKVRREVTPSRQETIIIPATYKTIEKISIVSGGNLEWREVICDTNSTPELISRVQNALASAGHNPGRADGVFGMSTLRAMEAYQRANGLIVGQLTMETMNALGVSY
jgi:peptidoglycan hydrolase-like protein with peptidoglycan-binding domain